VHGGEEVYLCSPLLSRHRTRNTGIPSKTRLDFTELGLVLSSIRFRARTCPLLRRNPTLIVAAGADASLKLIYARIVTVPANTVVSVKALLQWVLWRAAQELAIRRLPSTSLVLAGSSGTGMPQIRFTARAFATRFLPTSSRDDADALRYDFTSIRLSEGLSPSSCRVCSVHKKREVLGKHLPEGTHDAKLRRPASVPGSWSESRR
jgi:hypothetical protein